MVTLNPQHLKGLLVLDDSEFWNWIQEHGQVLCLGLEHLVATEVDAELLRFTFLVFTRLVTEPKGYSLNDWNQKVFRELFTFDRILGLMVGFGARNMEVIRSLIDIKSIYQDELFDLIYSAVGHLKIIQKRGSKSSKKDKGPLPEEDVSLLLEYISKLNTLVLLVDTSHLDTLFDASDLILTMIGLYEVCSIETKYLAFPSDMTLVFTDQDVDTDHKLIRKLKRQCLELFNQILQQWFIGPLQQSQDWDWVEKTCDRFCDLMNVTFELCPIDGPCHFLYDAPIVLDLEIEYQFGLGVKNLATNLEQTPFDPARLQYLLLSLEHLITFSGCAPVQNERMLFQQRLVPERKLDTPSELDDDEIQLFTQISAVKDIFPELGDGFIEACLVALGRDPEVVVMKVLEQDLPPQVEKLDRGLQRTLGRKKGMTSNTSLDTLAEMAEQLSLEDGDEEPEKINHLE